jgi:hypothetical protein
MHDDNQTDRVREEQPVVEQEVIARNVPKQDKKKDNVNLANNAPKKERN